MELRIHGTKSSDTSLYCPNCDDLIEPSICKKFKAKKGCGKLDLSDDCVDNFSKLIEGFSKSPACSGDGNG